MTGTEAARRADAQRCCTQLADLTGRIREGAATLEAALRRESDALRAADVEALESAGQDKLEAVAALDALEAERVAILDGAGFGPSPDDMQRCLAWCGAGDAATGAWGAAMQTTGRCRDLNLQNAAVGRVRHEQIRAALALLNGSDESVPLYDGTGRGSGAAQKRDLGLA